MPEIHELGIDDLRSLLRSREVTSVQVTQALLERIDAVDRSGPSVRSVIEVNPNAVEISEELDREGSVDMRGPLHGIPVLIKDNIDTGDGMQTTAGSLALLGSKPARDAFVVRRLREAGAIILGKANMSEWANFRSSHSSSGWSARGGQALNPYVLDRSPCGSSSGSASAVAASLVPASLGTETDGSILCPGAFNGVVGIKPSVGLTSRSGVIPISHSQDTVGTFGRSVRDAAILLGVIAGPDPADPATPAERPDGRVDYTSVLDRDGLKGARIGVPRDTCWGYSPHADSLAEEGINAMRVAGAVIVDPADIKTAKEMKELEPEVLFYEFKADLEEYLQTRVPDSKSDASATIPRTLADLIAFNEAHAATEMRFFGQEAFLQAQEKGPLTEVAYKEALDRGQRLSRQEGIDATMDDHGLDALVAPTTGPPFTIDLVNGDHYSGGISSPCALAGYPAITVPAGLAFACLPVGITFMGRRFSEAILIRLAYAFEQAAKKWAPPRFLPTLPLQ